MNSEGKRDLLNRLCWEIDPEELSVDLIGDQFLDLYILFFEWVLTFAEEMGMKPDSLFIDSEDVVTICYDLSSSWVLTGETYVEKGNLFLNMWLVRERRGTFDLDEPDHYVGFTRHELFDRDESCSEAFLRMCMSCPFHIMDVPYNRR